MYGRTMKVYPSLHCRHSSQTKEGNLCKAVQLAWHLWVFRGEHRWRCLSDYIHGIFLFQDRKGVIKKLQLIKGKNLGIKKCQMKREPGRRKGNHNAREFIYFKHFCPKVDLYCCSARLSMSVGSCIIMSRQGMEVEYSGASSSIISAYFWPSWPHKILSSVFTHLQKYIARGFCQPNIVKDVVS